VRAVEDADLSCSVHFKIVGNDNVETALIEGNLGAEIGIALDDPKVKIFTCVDHFVVEAEVYFFVLGVAGVYSVNKRVAENVIVFYPRLEVLAKLPEVCILKHAFFEICTVFVDKLARKKYESAKTEIESLFEKLSQLCREGLCGSIGELVAILEADSCLGGIRNYESEVRVFGKRHVSVKVIVGLDATRDNVDKLYVHALASAAKMGILTVLRLEHIAHALVDRLNDYYLAVKSVFSLMI
jgi:hypothetical protein